MNSDLKNTTVINRRVICRKTKLLKKKKYKSEFVTRFVGIIVTIIFIQKMSFK